MRLSIKNKLFLGFGAVLLVVTLGSTNTFYKIVQTTDLQESVIELRQPTVLAGMKLADGLHLSLAGLRAYMILGNEPAKATKFKEERAQGWQQIDSALAEFDQFSKNWTEPTNIEHLRNMENLIKEFRSAQQEIENIAHTDANVPSFNILLTEAAPRATKILSSITVMIDEEAELEATDKRKHMLKLMADSRGSFAVGLANIRAYLLSGDTQFRDNFHAKWDVNQARFKELDSMKKLFSPKQLQAWADYKQFRQEFTSLPDKMFESRASHKWNLANYWLGSKAAPKVTAIMGILEEMRISQDRLMAKDISELKSHSSNLVVVSILASVAAIIIGLFASIYLSRAINKPLAAVVKRAKVIANGNLSAPPLKAIAEDELGELTHAINDMSHGLQDVINKVYDTTRELAAASEQLAQASTETNRGMANQQQETQQVATAMNEMSATVQDVAHNASEAAVSANQADIAAIEGRNVVENNMQGIQKLADNIGLASETINKLGKDTESVYDIVNVISDIADQTNLLALNAAIEAARAGDQGRGFAVVADEVRTLAARTQESTEEISTMLERLKASAGEAVIAMQNGQDQATRSVEHAHSASESLDAITQAVTEINSMNTQIATASEQQSAVAEEMNRSIIKISNEAETALENTEKTDFSVSHINDLSGKLQEAVGKFKLA